MTPTRRQKILKAIVEQYIETGEPVGSKTLLTKLDMNVSSATIRNEMAALTQLGYIYQPYTSAGRIPTQSGYRYYVDNLMQVEDLEEGDKRRIEAGVDERSGDPEALLEKVGNAIVDFTNFAALSTTPSDAKAYIKNIEIVPVSSHVAMIILMTSTGIIKSKPCRMEISITDDIKDTFESIVSDEFIGQPLSNISTIFIQTLAASLGAKALAMSSLLVTVADLVSMVSQSEIRLDGKSKLLDYREYDDNLGDLLRFLSDEQPLGLLLEETNDNGNDTGIEVRIGSENKFKELSTSTTIIAKYKIYDGATGSIGIIGPTRMNYSKIIPSLKYLTGIVSDVLSKVYEEDSASNEKDRETGKYDTAD